MEVINGDRFVCARSCQIDTRSIQNNFNEGAIFADGPLEGLDVLAVAHRVNTDVPVLAGGQDVFVIVL